MEQSTRQSILRISLVAFLVAVPLVILVSIQLFVATAVPVRAAQAGITVEISEPSSPVNVKEGDTIDVVISLSADPGITVTTFYNTNNGSAIGGNAPNQGDFRNLANDATFPPGVLTRTVTLTINDDTIQEGIETFTFQLASTIPITVSQGTDLLTVIIAASDAPTSPTNTPTPSLFIDLYEPNNTTADAYSTAANGGELCDITLWPRGDVDYFKFWGREDLFYEVFTSKLTPGLDTALTIYNSNGKVIGSNDDAQPGGRASRVTFTPGHSQFFFVRVVNQDPSDPANRLYCLQVNESRQPTPTATPTAETPAGDECEYNSTLDTACLIGVDETKSLDFVPSFGSEQDTDVFRLWVKPGIQYTCETDNLSSVNDTNIILIDGNGEFFNPPIGNDDKAFGDLGSRVSYLSTYTGWLYIMVGPVNPPVAGDESFYTYDLTCTAVTATATPTATPTFRPLPAGETGGGPPTSTPTPIVFPTFPPSPTPIDLSQLSTLVPSQPPVVQFSPLPTATPLASQRTSTINVTLYYDGNENFTPELTEGIMDVVVALYDNATGQLIQFGSTNEAGELNFGSITVSGAVRVEVPFLGYSQIVLGTSSNILLRIAPRPLPAGIP